MDRGGQKGEKESGGVGREEIEEESGLTIVYTNAQSVIKKMDESKVLAAEKNPDIILLTETWTHDEIDNDFLLINGYEITVRKDRKDLPSVFIPTLYLFRFLSYLSLAFFPPSFLITSMSFLSLSFRIFCSFNHDVLPPTL